MANVEKDDEGVDIINVGEKVGVNGVNDPEDVMVVQAMLKYLTLRPKQWTKVSLPEPDGSLDKNTQKAIFDYQQYVRTDPYQAPDFWIAKDGSVSKFKKGLQLLHKQRLTITAMNADCAMLSATLERKGHIDAIVTRWPSTRVALKLQNPPILLDDI